MRANSPLVIGLNLIVSTSVWASDPRKPSDCADPLSGERSPARATTTPFPAVADFDAVIDQAVAPAGNRYDSSAQIKAGLLRTLMALNITSKAIHDVQYFGVLESLPPQYQFKVTTLDGKVQTVAASRGR